MGELRLAMVFIGIAILVGIYVYHQWRSSRAVDEIFSERESTEDVLLGADDESPAESEVSNMPYQEEPALTSSSFDREPTLEEKLPEQLDPRLFDLQSTQEVSPAEYLEDTGSSNDAPGEELVVMHLTADEDQPFRGQAVLKALQVHKMRFGEFNIYHRITDDEGHPESIFSIANMVKPGTLSPVELPQMQLPGLTFFLRVPAIIGSRQAFDDMLHVAQQMATILGGTLNDEQFGELTDSKIAILRSRLD